MFLFVGLVDNSGDYTPHRHRFAVVAVAVFLCISEH